MTDMLTSKDIQTLLQVDRSTIYRMAEGGRIPAIKVGKQWRFPKMQVEQWMQTHSTNTAPSALPNVTTSGSCLEELLPLTCVQLIQDTFADSLGVMIVIADMNGKPLTEVSHPCGLFNVISQKPGAVQKCIESWQSLAQDIDLQPKFAPSHLGLLCARGYIRLGSELKGMVIIAGIAPDVWPPTVAQIDHMADIFEVSTETLRTHIDEVFRLDKAEQSRILPFVQKIANIIAHIIHERQVA